MQINRGDTLTFHSSLYKWGWVALLVASGLASLYSSQGRGGIDRLFDIIAGAVLLGLAGISALWRDAVRVSPGLGLVTKSRGWGPFVQQTHWPTKSVLKVILDADVSQDRNGNDTTIPTLDLEVDDYSRVRLCSGFKGSIEHKGELVSAALGVEIKRTSLFTQCGMSIRPTNWS